MIGLRVNAGRNALSSVQVVEPNGGESLYLGAMNTVRWSGLGLANGTVKLELLVDGAVAGTITEGIPGGQTSYQWQAGKMLGGWVITGTSYKVRVTAAVPPAASGTTYYVYDSGGRLLSEYDGTGTCVKDYLYLGGKMIGEFVPSTGSYYYYASDQINSTRLVTDATGAVVHSAQYDPYGGLYKTWVDAYHPKPGFSGKEREFGSEMDYFGARYYGHGEYRFTSIDPVLNKEKAKNDPHLWNLYVYCGNNPMSLIDPNGRDDISIQQGKLFADVMSTWTNTPYAHLANNAVKGPSGGGDCSGITWAGLKETGLGVPYSLNENNSLVYFTTREFHNWVEKGYFTSVAQPRTGDIGHRTGHMLVYDSRLDGNYDSWSTHETGNNGLFGQAVSSGFGGNFNWYRRTSQFSFDFTQFSLSNQKD